MPPPKHQGSKILSTAQQVHRAESKLDPSSVTFTRDLAAGHNQEVGRAQAQYQCRFPAPCQYHVPQDPQEVQLQAKYRASTTKQAGEALKDREELTIADDQEGGEAQGWDLRHYRKPQEDQFWNRQPFAQHRPPLHSRHGHSRVFFRLGDPSRAGPTTGTGEKEL